MNYIATVTQKPYEKITIEEIFEAHTHIINAKTLSMETISGVLEYMETQVHLDGIEDFQFAAKDKPFMGVENDETKEQLHSMFSEMKKAQQYVFLKRFASGDERITYKQLAKETRLIELCKEDEVCRRNFTRGSLTISRPKGEGSKEEEEFTDVIFVKIEFMDYLYRDALKKLRTFVVKNELLPSDFEGWLEEWMLEELNNL